MTVEVTKSLPKLSARNQYLATVIGMCFFVWFFFFSEFEIQIHSKRYISVFTEK